MKSGLDKDVNLYMEVVYSPNWLSTILGQRLVSNPGEKFIYSTPATHLLSAILTRASGKNSFDFVTENLLLPMETELSDWEKDPQGIYFGGNNMYFTTRNMAALGLIYLNNGSLNSRQIVPTSWVNESLKEHSNGLGDWGIMNNIGYGYLWWLGEIANYKVFAAIGHGGQFILCVPELDLIVATNAYSNIGWDQANIQELEILNIIGTYIIPAVKIN
jgi:CubicO group peptidase (beta-lactamase class C family)